MDDEPFARRSDDSDRCGISVRGKPPLLRLATRQGVFWIPAHNIAGIDEREDRFVIHFRARTTQDLRDFVTERLSGNPIVASTNTSLIFEHDSGPLR